MKHLKISKHDLYGYLIGIISAELVGLVAGIVSAPGGGLYETLVRPPLSPPGWVFPVVWVILYGLMGAAAYRIYKMPASEARNTALGFYVAQLAVNFLWPVVFFRFGAYGAAVAVILLLAVLVVLTVLSFMKVDPLAGRLLLPYLAWVLFAVYLNLGVYILNR